MDLATENRIAAILMKEAAELRRQADKEGLDAYLRDPKARGRPNSRFLTATVLGVQQANRAVEVNEMWRVRQKEKELNERVRERIRDEGHSGRRRTSNRDFEVEKSSQDLCSSSRRRCDGFHPGEEEGLKDEQIEEFLRARTKRGRGAVGSRMDETGPYLAPEANQSQICSEANFRDRWESRVLGPEKPLFLKNSESYDEELECDQGEHRKSKMSHSKSVCRHSEKHRTKEKLKAKSMKEKEKKRSKHRE